MERADPCRVPDGLVSQKAERAQKTAKCEGRRTFGVRSETVLDLLTVGGS